MKKHPKNFLDEEERREEREKRLEELRNSNLDEKEIWAMILAALKTFLPAVIGICLGLVLLSSCVLHAWQH